MTDDTLNTAEMELSVMLARVLEGPLGPLRTEVTALKKIEPSIQRIVDGIHSTVCTQAADILKQLGDIQNESDGECESLAAAQAALANTLARLNEQLGTLAAEHAQIAPALESAMARLDGHASRILDLLAALQTDTASRLQETEQRLEANLSHAMVSQADRQISALAPQLAAAIRLGGICVAGIVLILAAGIFHVFWH
jgi:chromosome segregation ATPase